MAKASKAQLMSLAKFKQEKRDTLTVDLPKGTKDGYKQSAAKLGMSLTKLIQRGIEEYVENHAATDAEYESPAQVAAEKLSADERRLVEEFAKLPVDVRKAITKIISAVNSSKGDGGNGNE